MTSNSNIDNARKKATKQFQDSAFLLDRPEELRTQADKEGYLFFRGVLPKDQLMKVRAQIMDVLRSNGLLDERFDPLEGIGDAEAINRLEAATFRSNGDIYYEIQRLELFHALAHEPALLNIFRILFGETALPHPRNIARIITPHKDQVATPPHQDFIHVQGTPHTWTAWFPLGDCPKELGSLSMLEGSHKQGILGVQGHKGAGGLESILCGLDYDWVEGDFQLGDVIVFHSQTVHKALPNQQKNKIRVSCDFRYQPVSQPIDQSSLLPHGNTEKYTWENIYKGWSDSSLQYYWKQHAPQLADWDESIRWQKEKIC